MRSGLPLVLVLLVFGQASGIVWWASQDVCVESCADDAGGEESCPPVCASCACARPVPSLPSVVIELALVLPSPTPVAFVEGASLPDSPEPHEILHVPILLG